jgi:uncharacterized lipoprotein YajG
MNKIKDYLENTISLLLVVFLVILMGGCDNPEDTPVYKKNIKLVGKTCEVAGSLVAVTEYNPYNRTYIVVSPKTGRIAGIHPTQLKNCT